MSLMLNRESENGPVNCVGSGAEFVASAKLSVGCSDAGSTPTRQ